MVIPLTPSFLLPFWTGQRWKKPGLFYRSASLRPIRPRTDSEFSVAPNCPPPQTNKSSGEEEWGPPCSPYGRPKRILA